MRNGGLKKQQAQSVIHSPCTLYVNVQQADAASLQHRLHRTDAGAIQVAMHLSVLQELALPNLLGKLLLGGEEVVLPVLPRDRTGVSGAGVLCKTAQICPRSGTSISYAVSVLMASKSKAQVTGQASTWSHLFSWARLPCRVTDTEAECFRSSTLS